MMWKEKLDYKNGNILCDSIISQRLIIDKYMRIRY